MKFKVNAANDDRVPADFIARLGEKDASEESNFDLGTIEIATLEELVELSNSLGSLIVSGEHLTIYNGEME